MRAPSRLAVIILSLLRSGGKTGYDVHKWLERHGPFVGYATQPSQIYRELTRMEDAGWVRKETESRQGAPDANVFHAADAGREQLESWVDSPYQPAARPLDTDFQVRLMFSAHRGPAKALELVRTELAYRRANEVFQQGVDEMLTPEDADEATRAWLRELSRLQSDRGHYLVATLIAWLESAEVRLEALCAETEPAA